MKWPRFFRKEQVPDPFGGEPSDLINLEMLAEDSTEVLAHDVAAGDGHLLEAAAYARTMSAVEVETVINRIVNEHDNDPNFPTRVLKDANCYLFDIKLKEEQPAEYQRLYDKLKVEAAMIVINSPYPEVRAVVDNHDDPWVPVGTFRAWTIGTVLVVTGGFVNQFFSIRYPAIGIGSNVAQIAAVPLAKLLELLPNTEFVAFGYTWTLNPGPFNPKEHMLITIMANVGFYTPSTFHRYYLDTISAALLQPGGPLSLLSFPPDLTVSPVMDNQLWLSKSFFLKVDPSHIADQALNAVLIALSTNLMGYGLAGLTRRFLVYPASAIWLSFCQQICRYLTSSFSSAQELISIFRKQTIALNRAFHADCQTVADGWSMSRLRWFLYCFCAMFVYFWFPDFICSALSYSNWMTWISPTNVSLAAITGSLSGLGFNPLPTFDWNQMMIDPLINPFFTIFNYFLGALITFPIIVAIWYTNTWNTGYLPINSNLVFDNTGKLYSVTNTLGTDKLFNQTMYENYSPAYLSASYAMQYGVWFAVYPATLSYAFLNHRREFMHIVRNSISRDKTSSMPKDIHVRLMESYREVAEWQYFMQVLVLMLPFFSQFVCQRPDIRNCGGCGRSRFVSDKHDPSCCFVRSIHRSLVCGASRNCSSASIRSSGQLTGSTASWQSITNVTITLNVISEMFGGFWFPGNAVAMNYFKTYGLMATAQTISFASDLKLAHYMHIPPQLTFSAQIYATIISTFVCTSILNFQMTKIPGVCTPDQPNHFTCPEVNVFFTASILWGTLGPKRMFEPGGTYNGLFWCFLIGAILPIPVYFLRKKIKALEFIHIPILLSGGLIWAPYSLANVWPAVPIGYLFNVFIKRRYIAWWSKYNYVTTAAFSTAIAVCAIIIFFGIEWPGVNIKWSGNNRPFEGCDAMGCARLPIPAQGFFGPGVGDFH
ncbi:OPT-domain-containing protein [Mycena sanguinolenta]|uniref:OPT-domain-containing protein n=1 Tax=Mycena sanguinolenta TaxID=230812 RepID=A0A8H6ZD26_9AGAR|nr:OPT-domain-containing protein [Mycena sanguinolenta]